MKKIAICGGSSALGSALIEEFRSIAPSTWITVYDIKYPKERMADEYNIFDLTNPTDFYAGFRWSDLDAVFQLANPPPDTTELQRVVQRLKINMNVLEVATKVGVKHIALFQWEGTSSLAQLVTDLAGAYDEKIKCWAPFYGEPMDGLIREMARTAVDELHTMV